ncbi:NAD(P)-binding protein, partial [Frankia sp. AgKG'84/4]|uniref:NAD(P)-binding protein n=1 Tax=Frankia sp. AgKG'84/4 TaxID=573490 RepID=UPI002029E98A
MVTLTRSAGHAPAPRIVIVGGGLSGLTLARALHVRGLAATVYELDAEPTSPGAAPGHPLDLRADAALRALEIARMAARAVKMLASESRAATRRVSGATGS